MALVLRNKALSKKIKPEVKATVKPEPVVNHAVVEINRRESQINTELFSIIDKLTSALDKPKPKVNLKATIQRDKEGRMSSILITDI